MFLGKEKKLNWWAVLLCAVATLVFVFAGVFWFDIPVYVFLHRFDSGIWKIFGAVFNTKAWLLLSGLVVLVFYVRKILDTKQKISFLDCYKKIRGSYAFFVFCSVLFASVVGGVLKFVIGRMRPIFYEALNMVGFFPFTNDWAFHSMPSGHTMATFAGLVTIGLLAPRAKWFTWTLAILVGVSRVCVGMHWPSDVILGAFIGIVAANLVYAGMTRRYK